MVTSVLWFGVVVLELRRPLFDAIRPEPAC
jgi:hypothetical protein